MRNEGNSAERRPGQAPTPPKQSDPALPLPTPQFRRRAWVEFQRALDPLSPPRPLRKLRHH